MSENIAVKAGTVTLGELPVYRLGLGTNRITDTEESRALLKAAVNYGVNFIDTAHRYTGGASKTALGNTLSPYEPGLVIATKCGVGENGPDSSETALRQNLEDSLSRLKIDQIDLFQLHRVDPKIPIEESVATLKKFQDEGKIRHIGLSEVSVEQLKAAQSVAEIVSVQNEYNVLERKYEDLLTYCEQSNIIFIPWFPLGGLAGGAEKVAELLKPLANKYSVLPQQLALAWLLKRSPVMLPIPGTLSVAHLESNLRSAEINLTEEDCEAINNL